MLYFEIKGQDLEKSGLMKAFCSSSPPGLACQGDECSDLRVLFSMEEKRYNALKTSA